jgi:hypothetical protein
MSFYSEARKYNAALSRLTTLTGREAEKKRRFYSSNKTNPLRTLVVRGTTVKTHVDPAAHAAAEAGAGFAAYSGAQRGGAGGGQALRAAAAADDSYGSYAPREAASSTNASVSCECLRAESLLPLLVRHAAAHTPGVRARLANGRRRSCC